MLVATLYTQAEALDYIARERLKNATVERDMFSGMFNVYNWD